MSSWVRRSAIRRPCIAPCGLCPEGSLCAADCLGLDPPYEAGNFRCVDDPLCPPEDFETAACLGLVCGHPLATLPDGCESDDPLGIDIMCGFSGLAECSLEIQDCPEGEKCIGRPAYDTFYAICTYLAGSDPVGAPCTGAGAPEFTDSCDEFGQCWSGAYSLEPFVGECLGFCGSDDPPCPVGSICEPVAEALELCVPTP